MGHRGIVRFTRRRIGLGILENLTLSPVARVCKELGFRKNGLILLVIRGVDAGDDRS